MNHGTPATQSPAAPRLPLPRRSDERKFASNLINNPTRLQLAFTKVELLVVMTLIAVVIGLLVPALSMARAKASRIRCANQLKSMGYAFRVYANDSNGKTPFQVLTESATNGSPASSFGVFDSEDPQQLWRVFQEAGHELSSPKILICPSDTRPQADDFKSTNPDPGSFSFHTNRSNALSYFYAPETREDRSDLLVVGDRNLYRGSTLLGGNQRLGSTFSETKSLEWGSEMHRRAGNIAFSDGHVEQLTTSSMREALVKTGDANNAVWLPNP